MERKESRKDELAYSVKKNGRAKGRKKMISDATGLRRTKRDLRTLERLADCETKRPERDMIGNVWGSDSSEAGWKGKGEKRTSAGGREEVSCT